MVVPDELDLSSFFGRNELQDRFICSEDPHKVFLSELLSGIFGFGVPSQINREHPESWVHYVPVFADRLDVAIGFSFAHARLAPTDHHIAENDDVVDVGSGLEGLLHDLCGEVSTPAESRSILFHDLDVVSKVAGQLRIHQQIALASIGRREYVVLAMLALGLHQQAENDCQLVALPN